MPIPKPGKGEDKNEFMSRCMSDETMKKEFPDQKQRLAVCLSQWARHAETKNVDGNEMEYRNVHEVVPVKEENRAVTGVAVVFGRRATIAGVFQEEWAPDAEIDYHDPVVALFAHDSSQLLGSTRNGTLAVERTDTELRFRIELPDTTLGRDVKALIERGDVSGASVGFVVLQDRWRQEPNNELPIRVIERAKLIEISLTPQPAYDFTSVSMRSLLKAAETKAEFYRDLLKRRLAVIGAQLGIKVFDFSRKQGE